MHNYNKINIMHTTWKENLFSWTVITLGIFQTGVTSIYKVEKVVQGNRSDNHCNQLDAQPSVLLVVVLPATTLFY